MNKYLISKQIIKDLHKSGAYFKFDFNYYWSCIYVRVTCVKSITIDLVGYLYDKCRSSVLKSEAKLGQNVKQIVDTFGLNYCVNPQRTFQFRSCHYVE